MSTFILPVIYFLFNFRIIFMQTHIFMDLTEQLISKYRVVSPTKYYNRGFALNIFYLHTTCILFKCPINP